MVSDSSSVPPSAQSLLLDQLQDWQLEEAQAGLSELVRLVQEQAPQKITVSGEEAVVVISAKEFAKISPMLQQPNLHELLSRSPLSRVDLELARVESPVRDVEL
jgi:antitoxin Phd